MRSIQFTGIILACAFLLAACSGGAGAPQATTALLPSTSKEVSMNAPVGPDACPATRVYVADYNRNDVEIYPQGVANPTPCGKLKNGINFPESVYVDTNGRVYVSNYSGNDVTEYSGGALKLTIPTTDPAYDIFVGANRTLYAAEPGPGTVAEYKYLATTPFITLTFNGEPFGVATDNKNNLYVSYLSGVDGLSHVEKFKPKATTGTDMGFTVDFSGELKLDTSNNIVIGDRNTDVIDIFPPGATMPSRSFSAPAGRPVFLALDNAEANLYVSGQNEVTIIDYATGVPLNSIATGLNSPSGVALSPPAPY